MISNLLAFARNLFAQKRGNVLMVFAFAVVPMVFATGMGIDYARAARLRTKLNAIADAAALAAVAQPAMNNPSDADAKAVAKTMFDAQAEGLEGLGGYKLEEPDIQHPDGPSSRVVKITYTATSLNTFGGVLNMRTITIGGTSSATATAAPNMDFYIALDTSPSMALPTSSADIDKMVYRMQCSFACHSNKIENYAGGATMPKGMIVDDFDRYDIKKVASGTAYIGGYKINKIDAQGTYVYDNAPVDKTISNTKIQKLCKGSGSKNICIYNSDGSFVDSYWYALNQSIRLRVTDERSAVKDLMTLAQSYADVNKRVYHAGLYTFDYDKNFKTIRSMPTPTAMPSAPPPTNLAAVSPAAEGIDLVTVNDRQSNGCPPAPIVCDTSALSGNTYRATSFKSMLEAMGGKDTTDGTGGALPKSSGRGSNEPGDTPQGYLFLVTDGMSDEYVNQPTDYRTRSSMQQAQIDQCNNIKKRGFKIAILYTEYTTASIDSDKATDFTQWQKATDAITKTKTIAERLTQCASPDLMYTVKTDESISKALQALFAKAVANARLNK